MYEMVKTILSIIGLVALFVGFEYLFYQFSDKLFKNHWPSYILHGFILFCFALDTLYPG